jgi:hypothetical protein
MSDLQAIADRVEIEALRGEFADAVMMRDYDRLASLFTPDGAVRIPRIGADTSTPLRWRPRRARACSAGRVPWIMGRGVVVRGRIRPARRIW